MLKITIVFTIFFSLHSCGNPQPSLDGDWKAVYSSGTVHASYGRCPIINPHYLSSTAEFPFISFDISKSLIEFPFGFNWKSITLEDNFVEYNIINGKLQVFYRDSSIVTYQTHFFATDSFCLTNTNLDTICYSKKYINYDKNLYNIEFKMEDEFISIDATIDSNGMIMIKFKSIEDEFLIEEKLDNSISQYIQRLIHRIDFDSVQYNENESKYISDVALYDLDLINLKDQHLFRNITREYAKYHLRAFIHNLEKLCKGILHKSKYKGHQIE